jgi:hypothetical protein
MYPYVHNESGYHTPISSSPPVSSPPERPRKERPSVRSMTQERLLNEEKEKKRNRVKKV